VHESLVANSGLSALDWWLWRRQSLLAIFQFPFRNARERFDIEGDWLEGGNATRGETKAREPAGGCTVRPVLQAWQSLAKPVEYAMEGLLSWGRKTLDHRMAIFRQSTKNARRRMEGR
jgi:hypothetical protein